MPSQDPNPTGKQVSPSTARSTQGPQEKEEVEAFLASRQRPPSSQPHYRPAKGYPRHDRREYELGTIILAGPIFDDTRPAIVVHIDEHQDSFLVVPVLTYKGKGLKDKYPREKDEHMSICEGREGGWYMEQNNMPVLLINRDMRGTLMSPMSVVNFTEHFDILYDRGTLILGKLCEYSTQTLLEHYQGSVKKPPCQVRGPWPIR